MGIKVTTEVLGYINPEEVAAVHMPRSQFLDFVRVALSRYSAEVADKILPVAEKIKRFPLSAWTTTRGCGCLVGEYLIANDVLTRETAAGEAAEGLNVRVELEKLHGSFSCNPYEPSPPIVRELLDFGFDIDSAIDEYLAEGIPSYARYSGQYGGRDLVVVLVD